MKTELLNTPTLETYFCDLLHMAEQEVYARHKSDDTGEEGPKAEAALDRLRPFLDALAGDGPIDTRRLAIISTRHMSQADDEHCRCHALEGDGSRHAQTAAGHILYAAGHILYAPSEDDDPPDWMSEGLWSNLLTLAAAGWQRVELDSDGPVVPGLETFDW